MKTLLVASMLIVPLALTSCTRTERNVGVGAATGAVIGGVVTGRTAGVVAGAVIGGVTMAYVSKSNRRGWCYYKDRRGRLHEARCHR